METQENLIKQLSDQKYALDQAAIVAATDVNGVITYVNDKFCKISGYEREELIGRTHAIVNSKTHPPEFFAELWSTIKSGQVWQGEVCNRNKKGELYWVSTTIVPFCDQNNKPIQFMSIRYEITDLKKAQEVVKNLIEIYKNERIDDETFENFDSRVLSNLTVEEIQSKIGL